MKPITITDPFGDTLTVEGYRGGAFLSAEQCGQNTEIQLGPKDIKRLRKALKRALKELP